MLPVQCPIFSYFAFSAVQILPSRMTTCFSFIRWPTARLNAAFLKTNSPYVVGDIVKGRIYEISGNFGVFVAVDDRYSGLIPKREAQADYHVGQELECRVTEVKEDGKLSLSARGKAYEQIAIDAESVLSVIEEFAGVLPFDDKASPEVIQREFGLSKAAFKRAVGHLMKEKQVVIRDGKIWTAEKAK